MHHRIFMGYQHLVDRLAGLICRSFPSLLRSRRHDYNCNNRSHREPRACQMLMRMRGVQGEESKRRGNEERVLGNIKNVDLCVQCRHSRSSPSLSLRWRPKTSSRFLRTQRRCMQGWGIVSWRFDVCWTLMDLEIVVLLVYHNIFLDHVDGPFFAICIFLS